MWASRAEEHFSGGFDALCALFRDLDTAGKHNTLSFPSLHTEEGLAEFVDVSAIPKGFFWLPPRGISPVTNPSEGSILFL